MSRRWSTVLGLIVAVGILPGARAAPPAIAQAEINYLLGFIESSGCEFYRNGSWYDSKKAQVHLRYKYEALAASARIDTAEDFIDKAATKSSLSGQSYEVRCGGSTPETTSEWLRRELTRYRAARCTTLDARCTRFALPDRNANSQSSFLIVMLL